MCVYADTGEVFTSALPYLKSSRWAWGVLAVNREKKLNLLIYQDTTLLPAHFRPK